MSQDSPAKGPIEEVPVSRGCVNLRFCLPGRREADSIRTEYLLSLPAIWGKLDEEFVRLDADGDKKVTAQEIEEAWVQAAISSLGAASVSRHDKRLISAEVRRVIGTIDMNGDGVVTFEEFAHFVLLRASNPGQVKQYHSIVQQKALLDPDFVAKAFNSFRAAIKSDDGKIPVKTVASIIDDFMARGTVGMAGVKQNLEDYAAMAQYGGERKWEPPAGSSPAVLSEGWLETSTLALDYAHYMMLILGRKPLAPKLLMYDISGNTTKALSRLLFGRKIEGVWHSAVLVFGREWWYGGNLFRSKPFTTPFGKPVKEIDLGVTFLVDREVHSFVADRLADKYTENSYDVIENNCNNFSDDLTFYITGNHIPKEISEQPKRLLSGGLARMMRPFLNRWLGGFKEGEGDESATEMAGDDMLLDIARKMVKGGQLCPGALVTWRSPADRKDVQQEEAEIAAQLEAVHGIKAEEKKEEKSGAPVVAPSASSMSANSVKKVTVDIKYYSGGKFRVKKGVPLSQITILDGGSQLDANHLKLAAMSIAEDKSLQNSIANLEVVTPEGGKRASVVNADFMTLMGSNERK